MNLFREEGWEVKTKPESDFKKRMSIFLIILFMTNTCTFTIDKGHHPKKTGYFMTLCKKVGSRVDRSEENFPKSILTTVFGCQNASG